MTMRHSTCRRSLLEGDLIPDVVTHLEACEACRHFSEDLGLVASFASDMSAGDPPEGLADRVLARVQEAAGEARSDAAGAAVAPVADLGVARANRADRRPGFLTTNRGPLLATMSVAAVMLLLVGVLAALPATRGGDDGDLDPLLTAASRTAAEGSALVRLSGTVEATVHLDAGAAITPPEIELPEIAEAEPLQTPGLPDLTGVPESVAATVRADFEAAMARAREQHQRYVDELRADLERLREDTAERFEAVRIPRDYSFRAEISGQGAVRFGDGMSVMGSIRLAESDPPAADPPDGAFEARSKGGATYYRSRGGPWWSVPGVSGPLGPLVLDPDGVVEYLRSAASDIDDLGEAELDGVRVRHFRFAVEGDVVGDMGATHDARAEAWVGADDGLLRRLSVASRSSHRDPGARVQLATNVTIDLGEFGADVDVARPSASGTASSPFGPAAVLYPFSAGFSVAFHYGISVSEPPAIPVPDFDLEIPEIPEIPEITVPTIPMPSILTLPPTPFAPSAPDDPTEPTEPTEPSEPAEPTEPTEPT
jgi:hypothetical protein